MHDFSGCSSQTWARKNLVCWVGSPNYGHEKTRINGVGAPPRVHSLSDRDIMSIERVNLKFCLPYKGLADADLT